jgi:DNA-binding response OmpR family regulator/DNA-binding transcriptional ArsR family regulator
VNEQAAEVAQLPASGNAPVPLLLVADPDETLGHELVLALSGRGVEVTVCADGAQALLRTGALRPDVLLISASLPAVDAVTLVQAVRANLSVPVILGVGADDADTVVKALAAGANACVARPYRLPELLPFIRGARVEGAPPEGGDVLTAGPIELDPVSHVVRVRGRVVHLPLREFELLRYLMLNVDRVVSRQHIRRHVWKTDKAITNTISVHIRRLRERLGDDPEDPKIILTVRGVGYRIPDSKARPSPEADDHPASFGSSRGRRGGAGTHPGRRRKAAKTKVNRRPSAQDELTRAASALHAVADPSRLQLLSLIEASPEGEARGKDLTSSLGLAQASVSQHLKILVDAGLLTRDQRGNWTWYAIAPARLEAIRALLT